MTTPDTLASLIAEMKAEVQGNTMPILSDSATLHWAVRLEAALDALVEKWEANAQRLVCNYPPNDQSSDRAKVLLSCAAELRGRGASE